MTTAEIVYAPDTTHGSGWVGFYSGFGYFDGAEEGILKVGNDDQFGIHKSYFDFDISEIPDNAIISSVKLKMAKNNESKFPLNLVVNLYFYSLSALAKGRSIEDRYQESRGIGSTLLVSANTQLEDTAIDTFVEIDLGENGVSALQDRLTDDFFSIGMGDTGNENELEWNYLELYGTHTGNFLPTLIIEYTIQPQNIGNPLFMNLKSEQVEYIINNTNDDLIIKANNSEGGYTPSDIPGCIAWWKLEETTGSMVYNSVGTSNGVISGASLTSGAFGNARNFDGVNNRIAILSGAGLTSTNTNNFSISAWINRDATSGGTSTYTGIVGKNGAYNPWGMIMENTFRINFSVFNGSVDPANRQSLTTPSFAGSLIPAGSWTHVVGTYDSTTGSMFIYINGAVSTSVVRSSGLLFDNNSSANIGGNAGTTAFKGALDEISIYNKTLTSSEVGSLYLHTKPSTNSLSLANTTSGLALNNSGYRPLFNPSNLPGCLMYFPFDDEGSSTYDTITGISGALSSFNAMRRPGIIGGGIDTGSENLTRTVTIFKDTPTTTARSVAMWFRHNRLVADEPASFPGPVRLDGYSSGQAYISYMSKTANSNRLGYKFRDSSAQIKDAVVDTYAIPSGVWVHNVFTFDNGSSIAYMNGSVSATEIPTSPNNGSLLGGSRWTIGQADGRGDWTIDEFAVFDRAITQDEVRSLYDARLYNNSLILKGGSN